MKRLLQVFILILLILNRSHAQNWSTVGSGMNSSVYSLEVFRGKLYASGIFTSAGGKTCNYIARWDTSWTAAKGGLAGWEAGDILHSFNGKLYVVSLGKVTAWNDTAYTSITGTFSSNVWNVVSYNKTLYSGGAFSLVSGVSRLHIAKYKNGIWDSVGAGFYGAFSDVNRMMDYNGKLYAVGKFYKTGSLNVSRIAIWNDTNWSDMGGGANNDIYAIAVFKGEIYIGGRFTIAGSTSVKYIAKWNGSNWVSVGGNLNNYVTELIVYNNELYVGGAFTSPGNNIMRFDGTNWKTVGVGLNNIPQAMEVYNNELYVGGGFTMAGGNSAAYIAKWNTYYKTVMADFNTNKKIVCIGDPVYFKDTSSGTPTAWKWTFPGGFPSTSTNQNPTIFYTKPGTYEVILSVSNPISKDTIKKTGYITVHSLPANNIKTSGPLIFCKGDSVILKADSTDYYVWSTSQVTRSITVKSSGNYYVKVKSKYGCSDSSLTITIKVNSPPTVPIINAFGSTSICKGDSLTLSTNSVGSYLWNNNAKTKKITILVSGKYSVTVTDSNKCSATSVETIVTVNLSPISKIIAGGATTFCHGDSVILNSSPANSYLWSNKASTQSITVLTSGNYSVTLKDTNNCSATSSVIGIIVHSLPIAKITPGMATTFCQGDSVMLLANTSKFYLWSNNEKTQNIRVSMPGNYFVTVKDSNGCTATSNIINVMVNSLPPVPTISSNGNLLTSSSTMGNQWFIDGNILNGATSPTYYANKNGYYTVQIIDSNGCLSTSIPFNFNYTTISKLFMNNRIVIIPNPNNGKFFIEAGNLQIERIRIFNSTGKVIDQPEKNLEIDLSFYPKGIYLIQIQVTEAITINKKVIIR